MNSIEEIALEAADQIHGRILGYDLRFEEIIKEAIEKAIQPLLIQREAMWGTICELSKRKVENQGESVLGFTRENKEGTKL